MRIGVPRYIVVGLAALFSSYHIVLAVYSLQFGYADRPGPVIAAIVLYAAATVVALLPVGGSRMPVWMAGFAVAATLALPLLVSSVLDPQRFGGNGYATWYVAAVGTLLTIVATRGRAGFAWTGIAFLGVQTILWGGPAALGPLGVIGSASWVGVSHIITNALSKALRDSRRFAVAEREATEWQAAQEAHLNERQFRLGQTSIMALPMLQRIRQSAGELTAAERAECLHLEGAIRDEIRGRKLLDDGVRRQVMLARRRGTIVTLLDEGGIDDLEEVELARVLEQLAEALRTSRADKLIARTVPEGSDVAVTVVGLRSGDERAAMLGQEEGEDEVELWLEIPRQVL
ncbi:hypothetical protein [Homoserinibacter sp. YIM 151385]|uniref:hypothetical protein n=1 Tax=Homoserinibacter sp. YIM 151385 TaxID=2985506 RepID=UPI0022F04832|nr:hypothetical protein [Homoserinibacter sp. YIM 151385]WBU36801.1 hypothetical protein OF852_07580 [Homoserinibacter sp. YIM 151385]